MIVPGLVLVATASLAYCPLCHVLKIGEEANRENYYISHLPRYNQDPSCILSRNGEFAFRSDSFMEAFPDIESLKELDVEKTPDLAGFVSSERLH